MPRDRKLSVYFVSAKQIDFFFFGFCFWDHTWLCSGVILDFTFRNYSC